MAAVKWVTDSNLPPLFIDKVISLDKFKDIIYRVRERERERESEREREREREKERVRERPK